MLKANWLDLLLALFTTCSLRRAGGSSQMPTAKRTQTVKIMKNDPEISKWSQ